jgi:hypothetical protein
MRLKPPRWVHQRRGFIDRVLSGVGRYGGRLGSDDFQEAFTSLNTPYIFI